MKTALKKSVILFLSLCIAIESIACGGGGYYMEYDMLFDRNFVFENGEKTTSFNGWIYNSELYKEEDLRIQNCDSWAKYLENVYRKEDLQRIIYRSATVAFDKVKEQKKLRSKRLSEKDISKKEGLFLDFIAFALKVEKVVAENTPDPWAEEEQKMNPEDFEARISEANAKILSIKDDFIKERYAFQLIKLYRYSQQWEEAGKTYQTYFAKSTSMLSFWAMEHYAGILAKQGKSYEANYYFIKVYTNCPSKRRSSYLSMKLESKEDFNKTLEMCASAEEKMALRFVRSMQTKALGLEDLQAITGALGNHEYARIIMTHEINKLEKGNLSEDGTLAGQDEKMLAAQKTNYTKELIAFNEKMLAKDNEDQFWHLSLAYLYYLNKQHNDCSALLEKVHPKSTGLQKQHTIIYIINYLATKETLTEIDENIIGQKLFELNENRVSYPFVNDRNNIDIYEYDEYNTANEFIFRQIYERSKTKNAFLELIFSGETISGLKSEYSYYYDEKTRKKSDVNYIDQVLKDLEKTPETTLSMYAAHYFFNNSSVYEYESRGDLDFEQCALQLKEIKATFLMRDPDRLEEAIALFSELPENMLRENIGGDPFAFDIKNPEAYLFDGYYYYNEPSMTKLDLAKKLHQLNKKKSSGLDYYKLGLAYYNCSYYGVQWKAMAYYRSFSSPNGFYSMKVAQSYFKKALAAGKLTEEQEAKIHFMLARCEQNEYTQEHGEITAYFNSDNEFTFDLYMRDMRSAGAFSHFEILYKNYRNTSFYNELIGECYYFNYYIN